MNVPDESPISLARRIVLVWPDLTDEERAELTGVLAQVLPIAWNGYGPVSTQTKPKPPDRTQRLGFIIERAPDGSRFVRAGWVPARMTDDEPT